MNTKFQHFILTKFNLEFSHWNTDKKNQIVRDEKWLKHRFDLFENICFPSIQNQTNQNFKWFVFFDINTPKIYKEKVINYKNKYTNFYPFFFNAEKKYKNRIRYIINKFLDIDKGFIITTRLDNDDAFHEDAIDIIQANFIEKDQTLLNPIQGICLQLEPKFLISRINYSFNPFISYIEKAENFETVFKHRHNSWDTKNINIIDLKKDVLWLQTIHNRNMLNNFRFKYFVINKTKLKKYNINKKFTEFDIKFSIKSILRNIFNINLYFKKVLKNILSNRGK